MLTIRALVLNPTDVAVNRVLARLDNLYTIGNPLGYETLCIDLEADSLSLVQLMMALEEEFDIEIPDEEAEEISTVGEAVNYIKSRG